MLTIGQKMPDFTMDVYHRGEIRKISSADFNGKWLVLVFYPGDETFVCPTELEELAKSNERFSDIGAKILSISRDNALDHKRWHESDERISKIGYPMGSDEDGTVYKLFGIYTEDRLASPRATYIFDPEGILRVMDVHDNRVGRSVAEILRMLAAAVYVQLHAGEMCPEGWKPGKPTIHVVPEDLANG
jgi:peroxiredoxin (alkyl hydroperoxide reductase subunit C)